MANPRGFVVSLPEMRQDYDAVVRSTSSEDQNLYDPITGNSLGVKQFQTGDGLPEESSACDEDNTKWLILEDPVYGVNGTKGFPALSGMDPDQCEISRDTMEDYTEYLEEQMAIDHAAELESERHLHFFGRPRKH